MSEKAKCAYCDAITTRPAHVKEFGEDLFAEHNPGCPWVLRMREAIPYAAAAMRGIEFHTNPAAEREAAPCPGPDARTVYSDGGWYWQQKLGLSWGRNLQGPFESEEDAMADARELACQD